MLDSLDKETLTRLQKIRVNASSKSHAELDKCSELDIGDIEELGKGVASIRKEYPNLIIVGGCCGTDERHLESLARHCIS